MRVYGGLIRWKFSVPLLAFVILTAVYLNLFMDRQLRHLLERLASDANGSEVNIGQLHSSILGLMLELQNVQISNPEQTDHNRIEFGVLHLGFSLSGLLRGKLIIDDARLEKLQLSSVRKNPAYVLPVPPSAADGPSLSDQFKNILQPVKQEVLQRSLDMLQSQEGKFQLPSIDWAQLPSSQALQGLQREWDLQGQTMQSALGNLPKYEDIRLLKEEAASIKMPTDLTKLPETLAELERLQSKTQGNLAQVQSLNSQVQNTGTSFINKLSGLDGLLKNDLSVVLSQLKLPDLDFKELADEICGPEIRRIMRMITIYYAKIRPYLESQERPAPSRPWRLAGTDFSFPERPGLPGFWLKKLEMSSLETAEGPLGNILGRLSNFSSAPELINDPVLLHLEGQFKQAGIEGLKLDLSFDHRQALAHDELQLKLAKFPIADRILVNSKAYTLAYYKANGALALNFKLDGEKVKINLDSQLEQITWRLEAESEKLKSLLDNTFAPLSSVHLAANADGSWQDLNWKISSNLVDQLRSSLQRALSQQLKAERDRLETELKVRLESERDKLELQVKTQLKNLLDQIGPIQKEAESLKGSLEQQKLQFQSVVADQKSEA
ncbi:MAG: TIGR03545 family protein, partial [Proteobacteria bacterium]|nr:TIGR03545 family protein [Pseudomonadota bacterium]